MEEKLDKLFEVWNIDSISEYPQDLIDFKKDIIRMFVNFKQSNKHEDITPID